MADGPKNSRRKKVAKKRRDEHGNGQTDLSSEALRALNHQVRRQILRFLHEPDGPRSPIRVAKKLGEPVNSISYHFKELLKRDIIALKKTIPARGAVEHVYASKVSRDLGIRRLLEMTRRSDQSRTRRR